jgi:hypothetical protein
MFLCRFPTHWYKIDEGDLNVKATETHTPSGYRKESSHNLNFEGYSDYPVNFKALFAEG